MTKQTGSKLAWGFFGLIIAFTVAGAWLNVLNSREASGAFAATLLLVPSYGFVGTLIASKSGNPIGWLFLSLAFIAAFTGFAFSYAVRAVGTHPGSLPLGSEFAAAQNLLFPLTWMILGFVVLLFPDGHLPSRRWRPIAWLLGGVWGSLAFWTLVAPIPIDMAGFHIHNPAGVPFLNHLPFVPFVNGLATAFWTLSGVGVLIAATSAPFFRRRGAGAEVKAQLKWFASACVGLLVLAPLAAVNTFFVHSTLAGNIIFGLVILLVVIGLPVAVGIAVQKYRLYDIDIVIKKTVVFGLLAVFIAIVYAAIVGGIGALIGSAGSTTLSFAAAVVLAILFQPVRERAHRFADRIVYGKRATPYEVLAEFSDRMSEEFSAAEILPQMARVLGEGTGAERATVLLRIGEEFRPEATWPKGSPPATANQFGVRHQGEELGALVVDMPASDPMNPARAKLVQELASQAGLVLRNTKLIKDLRASRKRIVKAQEEERSKLEHTLSAGVERRLIAVGDRLDAADDLLQADPSQGIAALDRLQVETNQTLEELRDVARGIFPPVLADQGLVAALEGQARKMTVPTTLRVAEIGRFPRDVEATAYFCTVEALRNISNHAQATEASVSLQIEANTLAIEVADDGNGVASSSSGLEIQGMADRVDALGGTFRVTTAPGIGTTVAATLPIGGRE